MRRKNQTADFIRRCLCLALLKLMHTKDFDDITISEICETAGYGRTTYYRYFNNRKADLILWISDYEWQQYKKTHAEETKRDEGKALLNHIYNNRTFFLLLKEQNLVALMFQMFYEIFGLQENEDEDLRYEKDFLSGGYFGVIYDWTIHGCVDKPDEITQKFKAGMVKTFSKKKETEKWMP